MDNYNIGVVGGRDFSDWELLEKTLNKAVDTINPSVSITIVSGKAKGADQMAEDYADKYLLKKKIFPPDKAKYGIPACFFIRNSQIVDYSDCLIAFWDGKSTGTLDSIKKAKKKDIPVLIVKY